MWLYGVVKGFFSMLKYILYFKLLLIGFKNSFMLNFILVLLSIEGIIENV